MASWKGKYRCLVAAEALGRLKDARAIQPLIAALSSDEPEGGRCQVRCRIFSFDFVSIPAFSDGRICPD